MKQTVLTGLAAAALLLAISSTAHAEKITWRAEGTIHNPMPIQWGGEDTVPAARTEMASYFADGQHYVMDYVFESMNLYDAAEAGVPIDRVFPYALTSLTARVVESGLSYSLPPVYYGPRSVAFSLNADRTKVTDTQFYHGPYQYEFLLKSTTGHPSNFFFYSSQPVLPKPDVPASTPWTLEALSRLMAQTPSSTFGSALVVLGATDACGGICASATLSLDRFTTSAVPEADASWMAMAGLGCVAAAAGMRRRRSTRPETLSQSHQG